MASSIIQDSKYDEGKYVYKKTMADTSDINISIGTKLYLNDKFYGTIVKESEIFYYIQKEGLSDLVEFMKESLKNKISNKVLEIRGM